MNKLHKVIAIRTFLNNTDSRSYGSKNKINRGILEFAKSTQRMLMIGYASE